MWVTVFFASGVKATQPFHPAASPQSSVATNIPIAHSEKTNSTVHPPLALPTNLNVTPANAYRQFGSATKTTTAMTTRTNVPTVRTARAVPATSGAHRAAAFRCPGSATAIRTVPTAKTNLRLAASPSSTRAIRRISSVRTISAFRDAGIAIMITIAGMAVTKSDVCRGIVRNRSLGAVIITAFGDRRGAMESLIVRIDRMRRIVIISAKLTSSSALVRSFVFTSKLSHQLLIFLFFYRV